MISNIQFILETIADYMIIFQDLTISRENNNLQLMLIENQQSVTLQYMKIPIPLKSCDSRHLVTS